LLLAYSQDPVAGPKAKRVEGHVLARVAFSTNRHVVARAADQRGDGATKGFDLVPSKEFRLFGRKALGPPGGPRRLTLRLERARFQAGSEGTRMISNGSKDTRIADGVDHVYESIGNGYAATPGRFVGGVGATLRGMGLLVVALLVALALAGRAQAQAPVGLGTADSFAVLAGSTVTNTGPTVITGDLGLSPGTSVTGFPPGTVNGTQHITDAVAGQAQTDLTTAYNTAAAQAPTGTVSADLGGQTLTPGVYNSATSLGLTGALTLDAQGNANAVFVFQAGSTLTTASASSVNLVNALSPATSSGRSAVPRRSGRPRPSGDRSWL
jgi:Ice-binding-like